MELEAAVDAGGTITALQPQRRNSERANLQVDGAFVCAVAWEVVLTEGLRVGDALDADAIRRLQAADEQWRAKESALALLAVRPRARRELQDRLQRKGFSDAATQWALAEADRLGLIDDRAFAEAWVRDRVRLRPRGPRALQSELQRKGVAPDIAAAAVAAAMRDTSAAEDELCLAAAEKWVRGNARRIAAASDLDERRALERRLSAYLMRRGFAGDAVRTAVRSSLPR
jgi:regulatory protein